MLQHVKNKNAAAGRHHVATANPNHSNISPKKFAPDTKLNIPPGRKNIMSPQYVTNSKQLQSNVYRLPMCQNKSLVDTSRILKLFKHYFS